MQHVVALRAGINYQRVKLGIWRYFGLLFVQADAVTKTGQCVAHLQAQCGILDQQANMSAVNQGGVCLGLRL